jgi:Uma2 family endonuclease
MATVTETPVPTTSTTPNSIQGENRVVIRGVGWDGYQTLLKLVGNQPVRLTYDRGDVELTLPIHKHERKRSRFGRIVRILADELNVPVMPMGSATWDRKDLEKALEADESFYLGDLQRIRDPDDVDLEIDPPPDLAVEIEITCSALNRLGIYGALRVPEIWRFNGRDLKVLLREDDGSYRQSARSTAFPDVPMAEIERFAIMEEYRDENEWARQFREWVRAEVLPRRSS